MDENDEESDEGEGDGAQDDMGGAGASKGVQGATVQLPSERVVAVSGPNVRLTATCNRPRRGAGNDPSEGELWEARICSKFGPLSFW